MDDPVDDALRDLRVTGTIVLSESYSAPWAIDVPDEAGLRRLMRIGHDYRALPFHLVLQNGFILTPSGRPDIAMREADVALCAGLAHRLSSGHVHHAVPLEALIAGDGPARAATADPDAVRLVCGVFVARSAPLNPLLTALPDVLRVSTGPAKAGTLAGVAAAMVVEATAGRSGFSLSRLLEVFCAELIRAHQIDVGVQTRGWFRGLADARVGEAIRAFHAEAGRHWSVETLAATAALSPSRFAARFREKTGVSVMTYVARWRITLACRALRGRDTPIAQVAEMLGYGSAPAFSRAFKAHLGISPAEWQRAEVPLGRSR